MSTILIVVLALLLLGVRAAGPCTVPAEAITRLGGSGVALLIPVILALTGRL